MSSLKGHQNGQGTTAGWRDAEGGGLVQPGEDAALGGPNSSFSRPLRRVIKNMGPGSSQHCVAEWRDAKGQIETRKAPAWHKDKLFHQPSIGAGCSKRLCRIHPWQYSRLDWINLCACAYGCHSLNSSYWQTPACSATERCSKPTCHHWQTQSTALVTWGAESEQEELQGCLLKCDAQLGNVPAGTEVWAVCFANPWKIPKTC